MADASDEGVDERLVFTRTAALALADPKLTPDEIATLRGQLDAAGSYDDLAGWAKRRFEAAYVGYVLKFGSPRAPDEAPEDISSIDNELQAIHVQHQAEIRAEAAQAERLRRAAEAGPK